MRFIFCIIAVLIQFLFLIYVYGKQDKNKAALKVPLLFTSVLYMIVQFYVFFKYCLRFPDKFEYLSYLLQGAVLIIFILLEIVLLLSNRYIKRIENQEQNSVNDFNDMLQKPEVLRVEMRDEEKIGILDSMLDKMRYMDPVSTDRVQDENRKIKEIIQSISAAESIEALESKCRDINELLEIRKIKNTRRMSD